MQGNLQKARVIRSRKQKFTILDNVSGTLTPVSPFSPQGCLPLSRRLVTVFCLHCMKELWVQRQSLHCVNVI